jgi:hypothetical protein
MRGFRLGLFEVSSLVAIQPTYEDVAESGYRSRKNGEDNWT